MHGETPPTTNAPPVHPHLTETPSSRKDGGPAGLFGNTQEARNALSRELCKIQVVKLADLLQLILPLPLTDTPLPAVAEVVQQLKDSGALVPTEITGPNAADTIFRWADFDQLPAEMKGVPEATVFQRISVIVDKIKIAVLARHGPSPTMTYMDEPNRPPKSFHRTNSTRPDGYFYFDPDTNLSKPEARKWYNIGVVAEYKKHSIPEDIHDNIHKILWGMNHIMREDPTRRYTLGFTIENSTMMIWYCDRSQVAVSTSFDFIQMPDLLVDFFLRVMYAPRSSLGCDPTMELVPTARDGPPNYKITIYDVDAFGRTALHQFITSNIISDTAADGIVTCGTRVWSARELTGAKRRCVIKDYWVDHDRDAEGNILARIKNTFAPGSPHYNTLNRHLLTVFSHGKVPRDVRYPLVADTTLDIPDSARTENKFYWVEYLDGVVAMARNSSANTRTYHGPTSFVERFEKDSLQHGQRSHCRIAFAEEGTPLHQFTSLGTVFSVLSDIADCLTALHAAGWVHRDLSASNIIVVQDENGPRGVLTDFEYAKHRDDTREAHSVRTGTLYFMSVEVDAGKYLFFSERQNDLGFDDPFAEDFTMSGIKALYKPKKSSSFRYHPLNDWESVFWISTHFIIDREVKEAILDGGLTDFTPQSEEDRATQIRWARQLFYDRTVRRDAFTSESDYLDGNQCVHNAVAPIALLHLENMRKALVSAYSSVEVGRTPPTFEKSASCTAAFLLKTRLERINTYLKRVDVTIGHFEVRPPSSVLAE